MEGSIQSTAPLCVRSALALGIKRLDAASVPSASLAAELLLLHVLERDRAWLYAHPEQELSAEQVAAYEHLLDARAAGAPAQYLIGRQEFWGLDFEVTPAVLIPRPETEHLIEVALERLGPRRAESLAVADIGTGSGCIAVALARELPQARMVATDISLDALGVARRNAMRHDVSDRIEFSQMDLLGGFLRGSSGREPATFIRFDLIVSNPPYVARNDAASLQREVRDHEPEMALFGGPTGVEMYSRIIEQASLLLRPGGILVLELGYNAAEHVRSWVTAQAGWGDVSVANDLAGIPRVLSALRVSV
jgi:release factor glutamine methyltransferase